MAEELNESAEVLKIHDLRPAPGSKKAKIRVGRGEGSKGKTAGRGTCNTRRTSITTNTAFSYRTSTSR